MNALPPYLRNIIPSGCDSFSVEGIRGPGTRMPMGKDAPPDSMTVDEVTGIFYLVSPFLKSTSFNQDNWKYVGGWPNPCVQEFEYKGVHANKDILKFIKTYLLHRMQLLAKHKMDVMEFHAGRFNNGKPLIVIGPVNDNNWMYVNQSMEHLDRSMIHVLMRVADK